MLHCAVLHHAVLWNMLCTTQFQGAISDFHPIKESIKAAEYDPLLIRANEDDLYGDGNNCEVAVTQVR